MVEQNRISVADRAINVVAILKGDERYLFIYDDDSVNRSEALRTMGRFAANPDLSFTWYDAAKCSQAVNKLQKEHSRGTND